MTTQVSYEYKTTSEPIGPTSSPSDPVVPTGEGWELRGTCVNDHFVCWTWRRPLANTVSVGWVRRPKPDSALNLPTEVGKYVVSKPGVSQFVLNWPGNSASQRTWRYVTAWYGPIPPPFKVDV